MAIKLHTCGNTWIHGGHPCWKVKHPSFPRGRRDELEKLSGQRKLPVLEFEDGRVLREDSAELVQRISEGRLTASEAAG